MKAYNFRQHIPNDGRVSNNRFKAIKTSNLLLLNFLHKNAFSRTQASDPLFLSISICNELN